MASLLVVADTESLQIFGTVLSYLFSSAYSRGSKKETPFRNHLCSEKQRTV